LCLTSETAAQAARVHLDQLAHRVYPRQAKKIFHHFTETILS
jgi:hypothetical protein